jgi:hypothetical protein
MTGLGILYPQPAYSGNSLITSCITTVTSGSTTAASFSVTSPSLIQLVTLTVAGDAVRVYWEGSTPTSTSGHIIVSGIHYTWPYNQWANSKFILSASSTASVITASAFNGG